MTRPQTQIDPSGSLTIIYDGQCPVCSAYTRMARLRSTFAQVDLVDARSDHPSVASVKDMDLSLNDGMAIIQGERIYHGSEAMHVLSVMAADYGAFNRLMSWAFGNPSRAAIIYPWLVRGRLLLLKLLGRDPIT